MSINTVIKDVAISKMVGSFFAIFFAAVASQ